jgi:hypothetical protein
MSLASSVVATCVALGLVGCFQVQRVPNRLLAVGAKTLISDSSRPSFDGVSGLAGLHGGVEAADEYLIGSFRARGFVGGNSQSVAADIGTEGSVGLRWPDGDNGVFIRGGANIAIERNAYTGFGTVELPTMLAGYVFHGNGTSTYSDSMHLHIGPRASLALTNAAIDGTYTVDPGVSPTVGGEVMLAGEFTWVEARVSHFFSFVDSPIDVIESKACFAALFSLCIDTRHILFDKPFAESTGHTGNIGITIGFGLASGLDITLR